MRKRRVREGVDGGGSGGAPGGQEMLVSPLISDRQLELELELDSSASPSLNAELEANAKMRVASNCAGAFLSHARI